MLLFFHFVLVSYILKAEIKPFLYSKMKCDSCHIYSSTSFCSQIRCLKYFCNACWKAKHSTPGLTSHQPMQKGQCYFSAKKNDKNLRRDASRSQPLWTTNSSKSISKFANEKMGHLMKKFSTIFFWKYPL